MSIKMIILLGVLLVCGGFALFRIVAKAEKESADE